MRKKRKRGFFKKTVTVMILLFIGGVIWMGYGLKKQADLVKSWQPEVSKAARDNGISEYEDIAMAIIFTETKGDHLDIMQSSESQYGERGKITSTEESIQAGVGFLAQAIEKAKSEGLDIWTAVQAYNFGLAYIDYVKENGGQTSVELAEKYSKDELAPLLGNQDGTTYRYLHPQSIFYNGGHLYQNGGNFFYADLVKWNDKILKIVNRLP